MRRDLSKKNLLEFMRNSEKTANVRIDKIRFHSDVQLLFIRTFSQFFIVSSSSSSSASSLWVLFISSICTLVQRRQPNTIQLMQKKKPDKNYLFAMHRRQAQTTSIEIKSFTSLVQHIIVIKLPSVAMPL